MASSALIMGSSPIMMCVAIRLAESGWRVEIHDERHRPGGAWSTMEAFGHRNIEPAVHLLENRPAVYRHLVDSLGVELQPEFRPEGRIGRRRLGFHAARTSMFGAVGLKALRRGDLNRATIAGRSFVRSVRHLPTPFMYPPGGSSLLVKTLTERLDHLGVLLRLDSRIDSCALRSGIPGVECVTGNERRCFDRLVLSSRSHPRLTADGESLSFDTSRTEVRTILLHLAIPRPLEFGYVELMGDPDLTRVRNVGRFAQPTVPNDRAILALQIRTSSTRLRGPESGLADECVAILRERGLLRETIEALDLLDLRYEHDTIPDHEIRSLNRCHDASVLGITTTDFAEDLVGILDRPSSFWHAETLA